MDDILDLDRFPLDRLDAPEGAALVENCRRVFADDGMFNLDGFVRPGAIARTAKALASMIDVQSFTHRREHNVYFRDDIDTLPAGHPALRRFRTVNHTLCADQLAGTLVETIYEWPPLAAFLARVMGRDRLFVMDDPLARINVMGYRDGEALNWHFDRAQFTTTLLIQAPEAGGAFEYRHGLRSDGDPNFDGVARLLSGEDRQVRTLPLAAGTLNVFAGRNTAHRVTPVEGGRMRIIAVFSYFGEPGVTFSDEERVGFYGRAA